MKNPSELFNLPVIGVINTIPLSIKITTNSSNEVKEEVIEPDFFEIIEKAESFYICNAWYDESKKKPLLISFNLVQEELLIK